MPLTPVLVASVTYYLVVEVADTTWRYSITTGIESRVIPRERESRKSRKSREWFSKYRGGSYECPID
jgi:hypothetical protein